MAYMINEECVACDACYEACLFQAVVRGYPFYSIDWKKCTECKGLYGTAQCADVCPFGGGCVPDPAHSN